MKSRATFISKKIGEIFTLSIVPLLLIIPTHAQNLSVKSAESTINILFIGNSFTMRHDLNRIVEGIVNEGKPDISIYTEIAGYGGQSLFQHTEYYFTQTFIEQSTITNTEIQQRITAMEELLELTEAPAEYVHFWTEIVGNQVREFPKDLINIAINRHKALLTNNNRTQWDYVVLQTWLDVYPDLNQGYGKYAKLLGEIARAQGSKVIFYMTAPDYQNEAPVTAPLKLEKFDTDMEIITNLTREFQPYAVVPVPMAINAIQQGGTSLTFRYVNDFHPNQRTAFLTANMFYTAIFRESTEDFAFNTVTENNDKGMGEGLDPDGNPATVIFEDGEKIYLQQMAYNTVKQYEESLFSDLQEIKIKTQSGENTITQNKGTLQMIIEPAPLSLGSPKVTWSVQNADEIAIINEEGLLISLGNKNGFISVKASVISNPEITASSTVMVSGQNGITAIEQISNKSIKAYPNPFSDYLKIETSDNNNYKVYNYSGALIHQSQNNNNNFIDTRNWEKGFFILESSEENRALIKL